MRIRIIVEDDETMNKSKAWAKPKGVERHDELMDERLPMCTTRQSGRMLRQLPPKLCYTSIKNPWTRTCSFAMATKTLNATWFADYYKDLYNSADPIEFRDTFVGITVGCGDGFDALDTLRMGTSNAKIDKTVWRNTLDAEEHIVMKESIRSEQKNQKRSGEMHCIEPFTPNYNKLKLSAEVSGYDHEGFFVKNAVIAPLDGLIAFPDVYTKKSLADVSIDDCNSFMPEKIADGRCKKMAGYTLDSYVEAHVESKGPIHVLKIGINGYDLDVLDGGKFSVLYLAQYIEFQFSYLAPMSLEQLGESIDMLDKYGFTCYWAGNDILYRITGCWQDYYNIHNLANIACVHHKQHKLVEKMENIFLRTLNEDHIWAPP